MPASQLTRSVKEYWNTRIHDLEIATHPAGSPEFFRELEDYRYEKLAYLPRVVNFSDYCGKSLLEIGCGVGLDLARFSRAGAEVTGVDLALVSIELAGQYLSQGSLAGNLFVMDGEALGFAAKSFDAVYAHGVLQYTADPQQMIREIYRVLKPGGEGILMVYNRYSWMNFLAKIMRVEFEHQDAPVFRTFTPQEFRRMLSPFSRVVLIPERFPVRTRLQSGWKAALYNQVFVGLFNALPRRLVRQTGWHLMAFVKK